MMTMKAYVLFWVISLLAAGGLLLVVFRITRGWRPVAIRVVLRALAALWLLMPAVVEPGAPEVSMAPAFIVMLFDMTGGYAEGARVLEPMLILSALVIPVSLFGHWAWTRWQLQRAGRQGRSFSDMA